MSVTEGSSLNKQDDWRKKKNQFGDEVTRKAQLNRPSTNRHGWTSLEKILTKICHLYLKELASCRQLKTKNARTSTFPNTPRAASHGQCLVMAFKLHRITI